MSINLEKKQSINLNKTVPAGLRNVRMALGWDAAKSKGFFGHAVSRSIDLDASAVLVSNGSVVEIVDYTHLTARSGSLRHTGDNLTGAGDGDDESIVVDLASVPSDITSIVFTVNSYSGQTFDEVDNAYVRLVDMRNDTEIARFSLTNFGSYTGMVMATLSRVGGEWQMTAVGEPANGRTAHEIATQAAAHA